MNLDDALVERIRDLNRHILIRAAETQDGPAYTDLMNRSYRRQKPDSYFAWQFLAAPHPARMYIAWDGSNMAACYGVHVLPLSNGERCGFVVDLLIQEAYRNLGLHLLLEEQVAHFADGHGAVALAALPNPTGMRAHSHMPGWRNLGAVPTLELFSAADSQSFSAKPVASSLPLVCFSRPREYREWRFGRHPQHRYEHVPLQGGDFAVVKIFEQPEPRACFGDIVDFQCAGTSDSALQELFILSCAHLAARAANPITCWALPHTRAHGVLTGMGFRERTGQRFFCVRVLREDHRYLYDYSRWHLVQSDSEVY